MNPTKFKEPVPYRAVNTCRLGYKNQYVNVEEGNNDYPFLEPYKKFKGTPWTKLKLLRLESGGTYINHYALYG